MESAVNDKPKRRWYQFSLGALLLSVTVTAIVIGSGRAWLKHRDFCLKRADEYAEQQGGVGAIAVEGNETEAELEVLQAKGRERDERRDRNCLRIERAYRRAVWFPWERLWIDETERD